MAVVEICVVAALYYASAFCSSWCAGQVSRCGRRAASCWPVSCCAGCGSGRGSPGGAFLTNVTLGPSFLAVLTITAGNTLAPVCSYALLRRAGFHTTLSRLQDALALTFLGTFTGMPHAGRDGHQDRRQRTPAGAPGRAERAGMTERPYR
ncbi:hypothetical protein [Streptomyces sp. XY006]|uniref:hypothetical protein n=1 Tax=Streptomyces sp. XY006 TaxID=2021410 RepID=UPI0015C5A466|nr:hypothetical protein [Streptomyces sp. XY006]